jgi:hypothetical protein
LKSRAIDKQGEKRRNAFDLLGFLIQVMFLIKRFGGGLLLSAPATLLIWAGFADGTEPTSWIIFGIAAILGLPWHVVCLPILFGAFFGLTHLLAQHNVVQVNGWLVLMAVPIASGVIGAHINGMLLSEFLQRRNAKHNSPLQRTADGGG